MSVPIRDPSHPLGNQATTTPPSQGGSLGQNQGGSLPPQTQPSSAPLPAPNPPIQAPAEYRPVTYIPADQRAATQAPAPTTPQPSFNPMPTEPGTTPIIQQNGQTWIQQGATVTPIVTHNPETPLAPATIAGYNVIAPPQSQPTPQPVAPATPLSVIEDLATGKGLVGALFPQQVAAETAAASAKANSLPAGLSSTILNFDIGMIGEQQNQPVQVKNAIAGLVGAKPAPLPFTPANQKHSRTRLR